MEVSSPSPRSRRPARFLAILLLLALVALGTSAIAVHVWAEFHFRQAQNELKKLQLTRAREHLEKCLKVWPRSFRVNFLAARTARRLGDMEQAEAYLQTCQRLVGNRDEIVLERLLIRAQFDEPDEVQDALRDLVQKNHPDSSLILEALARGYALMFRFVDLDFILQMWRERDPDNLLIDVFQAWSYEQLGAREDATKVFKRIIERDPHNDEARFRLANLLIDLSKPAEAIPHLETIIRRHPDNLFAKVRLALSLHDMGQLDEAEKILDEVLQQDPNYPPALTARGRIALQMNQVEEAVDYLRRSAEIDRIDYPTHFLLHQALLRLDRPEELAKVSERLKLLESDTRRLHDVVVVQNSQNPNDPALCVEAGAILLRMGEKEDGLRWLQRALKIDPLYARAHAELAKYFESHGDAKRATYHRRMAGEQVSR
jgi:tetratricopeptide (TPR) repeat protein